MPTLRYLRAQRHLTQEQLATAADVSPSTVYHIEAGKVQPRPSIVRRLARALSVAPNEIDEAASRAPQGEPHAGGGALQSRDRPNADAAPLRQSTPVCGDDASRTPIGLAT